MEAILTKMHLQFSPQQEMFVAFRVTNLNKAAPPPLHKITARLVQEPITSFSFFLAVQ
jgi:hypothetical protein